MAYAGHPPRRGLFKCSQYKKQFTVTTGTVFESSHISVLSGTVEAEETYIGGRRRIGPTNKQDRAKLVIGRPGPKDKKLTPVVALVERKGRVSIFPVERVNGATLQAEIRKRVHLNSHMMTDDLKVYHALNMGFAAHDAINHTAKEYVRGNVHTATVEGVFSLKRGINGSFYHVSKGHLHRYCSEFEFRYNTRTALGFTDGDRASSLVLGAEGKRLTYKHAVLLARLNRARLTGRGWRRGRRQKRPQLRLPFAD